MPMASPTFRLVPGRPGAASDCWAFAFRYLPSGIIVRECWRCPCWPGSAAYAMGESNELARRARPRQPSRAKAFYARHCGGDDHRGGPQFYPDDPVKALFWERSDQRVAAVPIHVHGRCGWQPIAASWGRFKVIGGLARAGVWLSTLDNGNRSSGHVGDMA